jgi:hypothetical protein
MKKRDPNYRVFVKIDRAGNVIPGVLLSRQQQPKKGRWREIVANICCTTSSTTTTTTTVP